MALEHSLEISYSSKFYSGIIFPSTHLFPKCLLPSMILAFLIFPMSATRPIRVMYLCLITLKYRVAWLFSQPWE